jgi:hypothetical protein
MTTNWTQAEIDELMAERDAAEEGAAAAIQMRNEALARAHEALAILRAFVEAEDTQLVKAKGSGAAHLGFGMYVDAMDRARKLVAQQ